MLRRWHAVRDAGLPYLVCASEDDAGRIEGFAYAATYRPRPAYRFAVEDSVYVDPDRSRRGIGRLLLSALIERCTQLGLRQMIAVIGDSQNDGSIGLHASLGFARVGSDVVRYAPLIRRTFEAARATGADWTAGVAGMHANDER